MIYLSVVCFLSIEIQHLANEYAHTKGKKRTADLEMFDWINPSFQWIWFKLRKLIYKFDFYLNSALLSTMVVISKAEL